MATSKQRKILFWNKSVLTPILTSSLKAYLIWNFREPPAGVAGKRWCKRSVFGRSLHNSFQQTISPSHSKPPRWAGEAWLAHLYFPILRVRKSFSVRKGSRLDHKKKFLFFFYNTKSFAEFSPNMDEHFCNFLSWEKVILKESNLKCNQKIEVQTIWI